MSNKWENAFNSDSESVEDEPETVNEKDYYLILGVSKSSSQKDIKKSYREKARKLHPDKNPENTEEYKVLFQELCEAYSILSDPKKRELYDKHGRAGIKNQNFLIPQTKQDLERLFKIAFDEDEIENDVRNDKNATSTKPQCAPLCVDCKLEPLSYNNDCWEMHFFVDTQVICTACKVFDPKVHKRCFHCAGKGENSGGDILPSFFKRQTIDCYVCESKGHISTKKDKFITCPKCKGDKTITTKEFKPFHTRMVTCQWCRGRKFYCPCCRNTEHIMENKKRVFYVPRDVKENGKLFFMDGEMNKKIMKLVTSY